MSKDDSPAAVADQRWPAPDPGVRASADPVTLAWLRGNQRLARMTLPFGVLMVVVGGLGIYAALGERLATAGAAMRIVIGVLAGIALVAGILLLAVGSLSAMGSRRVRRQLDQAQWTELAVVVLPDDSSGRKVRTLVDSTDNTWRLAFPRLGDGEREAMTRAGLLWYVGTLDDGGQVSVRIAGVPGVVPAYPKRRPQAQGSCT